MKKNIIYVHHSGLLGGAPKSLTYLVRKINTDVYNATILGIRKGPVWDLLKTSGAKLVHKNFMYPFHGSTVSGMNMKLFIRNLIGVIPTYLVTYKYMKKEKPDIVHLNSTCLFIVAMATRHALKNKVNIICHIREPILQSFVGNILRYFNLKYVNKFIAIDEFDAKSLSDNVEKISVIYNFVDFKEYYPKPKNTELMKEMDIDSKDIVYLYLGRIVEGNGVKEMVKAFKNAILKNPNIKLVISGFYDNANNSYEEVIKKMCSNNDNIKLLSFVDDVPNLISISDCIVCPFIEPHFARSIVEGSAMKKFSIGNNIGGPNELIEHFKSGYLYSTQKEFEEYIFATSINRELREKLSSNAYNFALKNFDSEINSDRTFKQYIN
ncbi:glycosyltransferase [Exiguobacterium undae]|uniref:Glycosyltransferase n=1 Tax=Exiguobacterium undae TaxID=169177 RepID=A0ABX2V841_9BACL|nr:glycosyltransferase [Exiguobacterium undae]OAN14366.1 hypothetical protein A3783_00130 [Exiguobacterium undae]